MKASNPLFHRLSHHCKSIFAALSLILLASCHSTSALSGANPAEIDAITMAAIRAVPPLQVCWECTNVSEVHAYEAKLGSTMLHLTNEEIQQFSHERQFMQTFERDTTFALSDSTTDDGLSFYIEFFLRKVPPDTSLYSVVRYTYLKPYLSYEAALADKIFLLDGMTIQYFTHHPVLEPHLPPGMRPAERGMSPDSTFLKNWYRGLVLQIDSIFKDSVEKEVDANDDFYDKYGYIFRYDSNYHNVQIDYFSDPNDVHQYPEIMSLDGIEGEMSAAPFESMYLMTTWYPDHSDVGSHGWRRRYMSLLLGWAVTPDYYFRAKFRDGRWRYHWAIQPSDLTITLHIRSPNQ